MIKETCFPTRFHPTNPPPLLTTIPDPSTPENQKIIFYKSIFGKF